ncbi:unnamed protein product [Rotaria sp. Silwood2]|nr:unnamed protein product [Rotaria sp. Silwood2]
MLCAQCQGPHLSLSMECPMVNKFRQILKDEVKHAINEGLIHQVHIKKKSEILNMKTTQYSAQVSNVETLSAWKSESGSSCNTSSQLEQKQFGEVVNRLNDVLDITCRTECKIDKQVTRTDQLKIKVSIIKQEELNDQCMEHVDMVSSSLDPTTTISSPKPMVDKKHIESALTINENSGRIEQNHSIAITDDQ